MTKPMPKPSDPLQAAVREFLQRELVVKTLQGKTFLPLDLLEGFFATVVSPELPADAETRQLIGNALVQCRSSLLRIALEKTENEALVGKPSFRDKEAIRDFTKTISAIATGFGSNEAVTGMLHELVQSFEACKKKHFPSPPLPPGMQN